MQLRPRSYRRASCCLLSVAIVLLDSLSGRTQQTLQTEWSFPTQNNPRVVISNASLISINSWDKSEVSIKAEVLAAAIQAEEVRIKSENNKLDISCVPARRDRKIFLSVSVPAKAVLEIKTNGNTVQVTEPAEQIIISNASRELLLLSVPESSALDMEEAPRATTRRRMRPGGIAEIGIGRLRVGTGPPYVKVTAATAQVAIAVGAIEPLTRPPTVAATTIARRNSSMSQALRRSAPQLILPPARLDETAPVKPQDKEEGALKLETYLVNLNVNATDRAGRAIPDLKQDNFSVYEDGVPQLISFFSPQESPFNLVLLLDLSGSVVDKIDLIRKMAIHFLEVIRPQDKVAVITFTTDVTIVSHLTKDRGDLRENINYMLTPAGATAFYDAVGYVLVEELRTVTGQRNAVIAITDGEDNALQSGVSATSKRGSFLTFEELLDGVTEADALIYPIHLDPTPPQQLKPGPIPQKVLSSLMIQYEMTEVAWKQLQSLADASGGRLYHADRIEDLKGVFDQVAAELRTVYSLAYTPTNLNFDGRFRRIRVQVNKPNVAIRTRPGYYGR